MACGKDNLWHTRWVCAGLFVMLLAGLVTVCTWLYCRDQTRVESDQQEQNKAAANITDKRDSQIEGIRKDIGDIKIDVAVIRAVVAPRPAEGMAGTTDPLKPKG